MNESKKLSIKELQKHRNTIVTEIAVQALKDIANMRNKDSPVDNRSNSLIDHIEKTAKDAVNDIQSFDSGLEKFLKDKGY